jgi:hypothetical protein
MKGVAQSVARFVRPFATRENRDADLRPPDRRRTFTGAKVKRVLTDG